MRPNPVPRYSELDTPEPAELEVGQADTEAAESELPVDEPPAPPAPTAEPSKESGGRLRRLFRRRNS